MWPAPTSCRNESESVYNPNGERRTTGKRRRLRSSCPCFQRDDPTDEYFWPKARLGKRLSSCCERRRESNDRQSRCSDSELSETSCWTSNQAPIAVYERRLRVCR